MQQSIDKFLAKVGKVEGVRGTRSFTTSEQRRIRKYWGHILDNFEKPKDFFEWLESQPDTDAVRVFQTELNKHFNYRRQTDSKGRSGLKECKPVFKDTNNYGVTIVNGSSSPARHFKWLSSTVSPYRLLQIGVFDTFFGDKYTRHRMATVLKYAKMLPRKVPEKKLNQLDALRTWTFKLAFQPTNAGRASSDAKEEQKGKVNLARWKYHGSDFEYVFRHLSLYSGSYDWLMDEKEVSHDSNGRKKTGIEHKRIVTKTLRILKSPKFDGFERLLKVAEGDNKIAKQKADDLCSLFFQRLTTRKN